MIQIVKRQRLMPGAIIITSLLNISKTDNYIENIFQKAGQVDGVEEVRQQKFFMTAQENKLEKQ